MDQTATVTALIAIISTVVATSLGMVVWYQKTLQAVLQQQIKDGNDREIRLVSDNRESTKTMGLLTAAMDKLSDQQVRLIALVEDVAYGRDTPVPRSRS